MARGKQSSAEERIQKIDSQISALNFKKETLSAKIKGLELQKDDIGKEIQQREIVELLDVLKSTGKSILDVKKALNIDA
jgi:hypothetical protein